MTSNIIFVQPAPYKLEEAQKKIFTGEALKFVYDIVNEFDEKIKKLYLERWKKKHYFTSQKKLPRFNASTERLDKSWKIWSLPNRLRCRRVDIGDVSPSNTAHFVDSLNCDAQGVQVDFDDGHCPTWKNQIQGYHNIIQAVFGKLPGAPCNVSACPILMLRPRAWNIIEHNILVDGKEVPGALLDFAILMFHCGKQLTETGSGPFFYLSKLEGASEAKLWNDIFIWTQKALGIPRGTIKACVLIENILAAFETVEILYALKEHSLGLNCGIWDYIASIISKFGDRPEFLLPDRRKHVSAESPFLKSYREMIVRDCHERGAPATGGMVAQILSPDSDLSSQESVEIFNRVIQAKQKEIMAGVDGFLIYDLRIVPKINEHQPTNIILFLAIDDLVESHILRMPPSSWPTVALFYRSIESWRIRHPSYTKEITLWKKQCATSPNQMDTIPRVTIQSKDLLQMPSGSIYLDGLKHNIAVSILFFYYWLAGVGHFFYDGLVEDSATAEISRCQVWQCIRHKVKLEDGKEVTYKLVKNSSSNFATVAHKTLCRSNSERKRLNAAMFMCLELFIMRNPPDFITTYLNDSHKFRTIHNKALIAKRSNL